jgi:hypothetical protein
MTAASTSLGEAEELVVWAVVLAVSHRAGECLGKHADLELGGRIPVLVMNAYRARHDPALVEGVRTGGAS